MPILKKILLGILSPLFIILLFATAFDVGFTHTATNPATVKRLISDSGIYHSVVPAVLQQTKSISTAYGAVLATDPSIQSAANSALPPLFIQQNTEMVIDNTYDWLNGKIAEPDFKIDLSGSKTLFANKIADTVQGRLSSLPACSRSQSLATAQSGQIDAFNITCLPIGVSPVTVAEQVRASLAGQQDFLSNTTVTAADIKNNGSNQSIFTNQLKNAPVQYQRAKKTPALLILLTILAGAGIVFLSRTWQTGLRHIGINLVIVGVLMLVFSWALNRIVSTKVVPKIKVNNLVLQQDIHNLATDLVQQIDKNYWYFGSIYSVLGAGAIAGAEIFRRRTASPPEIADSTAKANKNPARR